MPEMYLDVDSALTEVPVNILALTDDTDFKTREVAIAYNQAGMDLVWNFVTSAGVQTQTAVTPTTAGDYDWVHAGDGMYVIEIPASGGASINNDTEGYGWFTGICTGVLHWRGPTIGFRAAGLNDLLLDSAYSVTRGLVGTALPAAAADAAGGLAISDLGGLPMDDLLQVSAAVQTAINAQYDGTTGLAGDTYPSSQAQVGNIATGSSAISTIATAQVLTTGTEVNDYTDTATKNSVRHEISDAAGVMELYYEFDVSGNGVASEVSMWGRLNGGNDTIGVYAYNWAGASWDQLGTMIVSDSSTD